MQQQGASPVQAEKHAKMALPAEAFQLAESHRLGKPTAYYRVDKSLLRTSSAFFAVAIILLAANLLIAGAGLLSGNMLAALIPLLIFFPFLLWAVYECCKQAIKALKANSAHAYFCQQGLVYIERWRLVVLRWDEIERAEIEHHFSVNLCRIKLGNGEDLTLVNAVGGSLSGQIRRRLLRVRKRHQHPEIFHQSDDFHYNDA